jgi:hypothetical protein
MNTMQIQLQLQEIQLSYAKDCKQVAVILMVLVIMSIVLILWLRVRNVVFCGFIDLI